MGMSKTERVMSAMAIVVARFKIRSHRAKEEGLNDVTFENLYSSLEG